jgi:hypothetical protein
MPALNAAANACRRFQHDHTAPRLGHPRCRNQAADTGPDNDAIHYFHALFLKMRPLALNLSMDSPSTGSG